MPDDLWRDLAAWWSSLAPEFVVLLCLPVAVAAAAFVAEALRARSRRRERGARRLGARTLQP